MRSLELNDWPFVSVVIPVFNSSEGLKATLEALQNQSYPKERFEIVVSDNNSTDGSDKIATSFPNTKVVYELDIQGAGAARNKALSVATGEVIAFTDADCIPDSEWLKLTVLALDNYKVDRVAGEIDIAPITPASSASAILNAVRHLYQKDLVERYYTAATANLVVRRSVFDKIGNFKATFLEDFEFGIRAHEKGIKIAYVPEARVSHPPRKTIKSVFYKGIKHGRGTFSMCDDNKNWSGKFGWKHPFRIIKILITPYPLFWERLPFSVNQLSLQKRLIIRLIAFMSINLAESLGYAQWASKKVWQD
ncbi:MAG: glycosyltransferase [Leptolyngbyaceae cyanobacterium SM1_1_3]|nr:glycosyltransferase [Leptolyngbyaceae cyanobacterium SM1_1_3]NJN02671.1 glycosyltransferase [Leptolyngbyaceae cyanobacterium RM1_1_2]NJO11180.1 glycosyltransferase [Leptolyngbyaceae cyanobacterium SL_1_1]NJO52693.1 glycosyltransferase [Leptolyngbyaceae cyanobacterium RM2_2_4]